MQRVTERVIEGTHGIRRHPVWWASGVSVAVGLGVGLGSREVSSGWLILVKTEFFAAGTMAFLVLTNRRVGFVRVAPAGRNRRWWAGVVAASVFAVVGLACRDWVWRALRLGRAVDTPAQLAAVGAVSLVFGFAAGYGWAALAEGHGDRTG